MATLYGTVYQQRPSPTAAMVANVIGSQVKGGAARLNFADLGITLPQAFDAHFTDGNPYHIIGFVFDGNVTEADIEVARAVISRLTPAMFILFVIINGDDKWIDRLGLTACPDNVVAISIPEGHAPDAAVLAAIRPFVQTVLGLLVA